MLADDGRLLAWLDDRLPASRGDRHRARTFRVRVDDRAWALEESGRDFVYRGSRSAVALRLLERLNELACFTNPTPTVHSGLVADESERGVWLPAVSGGGKSTLTAQLTLSGLRYATDEAVTVSADGSLTGWSKWLCLKQGSHAVVPMLAPEPGNPIDSGARWMVPPRQLGEVAGPDVEATVVAFPHYRPGSDVQIEPVSRAVAVAEIAPQGLNLRRHGIEGVKTIAAAVEQARTCVRVTYGDGWEASRRLMDLLAAA